jgi:hypothetical protein
MSNKKSFFERIFGSKSLPNNNSSKPQGVSKPLTESGYFGGYAGWGSWAVPPVLNADIISRVNSLYAGINSYGALNSPNDRRLGFDQPFIRSISDLAAYRTQSRFLARTNSYAQGILNNIKSYIISGGFKALVESDKNKKLAEKCQDLLHEWIVMNDFLTVQNECFTRSEVDGEIFIRFFPKKDGNLQIRFVEPEWIVPPEGESENINEWSLGIKTPINDTQSIIAYGVMSWDNENTPYVTIVPDKDILHHKNNCSMAQKRGVPSLSFDTAASLMNAAKIAANLQITVAAQASITYFREHESATQPMVDDFISSQLVSNSVGGQPLAGYPLGVPSAYQGVETTAPGSVLDIPETLKYVEPPTAKNTKNYLDVLNSALKQAVRRWAAPEYIATGESTEASYASSLTSESPFLRNCQRLQQGYKRIFTEIMMRVLNNYAVAGKIPLDWKNRVDLHLEAPTLETREILKVSQADALYYSMGAKSLSEVCAGFGGDLQKTQQLLRKEQMMGIVKPDVETPVSAQGNGKVQNESPVPRAT